MTNAGTLYCGNVLTSMFNLNHTDTYAMVATVKYFTIQKVDNVNTPRPRLKTNGYMFRLC